MPEAHRYLIVLSAFIVYYFITYLLCLYHQTCTAILKNPIQKSKLFKVVIVIRKDKM